MPKWLSYLMLIPGLVMAIQVAFGWTEGSRENIGLSAMLVVVGIALMGMSHAESLRSCEHKEAAREAEISFAFARMMATAIIACAMLGFSFFILGEQNTSDHSIWLFWFSLPFFLLLLTAKYYHVWRVVRFLYGSGQPAEGEITGVEKQIHHKRGGVYLRILYRFDIADAGSFIGESVSPYSPLITYEVGGEAQVLYDPANPKRNLLLNAWHGKGLHSKREYDKKLARPDEGKA